eukprot:UN01711
MDDVSSILTGKSVEAGIAIDSASGSSQLPGVYNKIVSVKVSNNKLNEFIFRIYLVSGICKCVVCWLIKEKSG